jgi:segregation and condensation protein B
MSNEPQTENDNENDPVNEPEALADGSRVVGTGVEGSTVHDPEHSKHSEQAERSEHSEHSEQAEYSEHSEHSGPHEHAQNHEQLDLQGGPAAEELFRAIEAILMVADEPVTPQLLGELLEVGPARAESLCNKLNERFTEENRGFVVARVAGGYRFQSHPDLAAYVERFVLDGQAARLSAAAMETLAIVAYKQPISRAQVAAIRGVNVDGVMRTLVQRNYVAEIAVDPGPGQATLFGTTSLFLQNLGLDSIAQIPPLGDLVPGAEVMEALEASLRVDSETGRMTRGTGAGLDGNPTEVPIGLAQENCEKLVDDRLSAIADEAAEGEELFDLETLDSAIIDAAFADSALAEPNIAEPNTPEPKISEPMVTELMVTELMVTEPGSDSAPAGSAESQDLGASNRFGAVDGTPSDEAQ